MGDLYRPDWNDFARANASQRWRQLSAAMGADATRALVEEARITDGVTVLDVASGTGEPAISIATALNGTGRVLATDISEGPLKIAKQRAEQRNLTNITFQIADAMALPFEDATFDRVTSRLGVMFFPDAQKALTEFHRVLKPNGQVSLLAWGSMDQPYFATTVGVVQQTLQRPLPDSGKRMFRFADPKLLRDLYSAAGFTDINSRTVDIPWTWPGTPADVWDYFQDVTVPFKPLLDQISSEQREEIDAKVVDEITKFSEGKCIRFGAKFVLATARKRGS
jgi:ubiquinone/menaquinone biosynthesis C-methylase UbiE